MTICQILLFSSPSIIIILKLDMYFFIRCFYTFQVLGTASPFYFIYLTLYLESCNLALNVNPLLSRLVLYLLIRDLEMSLTKLKMTQMVLFPVDVSLFVNMTFFISSSGQYNFVYIFFVE